MKLLLYCTKGKEFLWWNKKFDKGYQFFMDSKYNRLLDECPDFLLNGTIPCECAYELEDIVAGITRPSGEWLLEDMRPDILKESCLEQFDLEEYLGNQIGKAIHIKNLHIFDKPKRLNEFTVYTRVNYTKEKRYTMQMLNKAPQNMCYVWDEHNIKYALISIRPEWLCKILNGEKKIEVRKKVLRGMYGN